jgi:hypothetical protein
MQPQHTPGQGTQKIGALYVDCSILEFILIFGVTWGQVPWCAAIPPAPDFRTKVADNQNGLRLEHIFEEFSETRVTELAMKPKKVWYFRETGLSIVAKTITVSGRETHLLRVSELSRGFLTSQETRESGRVISVLPSSNASKFYPDLFYTS